MSIRWPYGREYEVNSDWGKEEYSEHYDSNTKKNVRIRLYNPIHTIGVQEQYDMDETVKKVCNIVFGILAIGALIGIGCVIGFKHKT